MLFAHILGAGGMYTKDYCRMMCQYFDPNEHCFISGMPNHENYAEAKEGGFRVYKTLSLDAFKCFRRCDYIICHGMVNRKVLLFFWAFPSLCTKTNWVIWGGDIYHDNQSDNRFTTAVIDGMRRRVYSRVRWATTLSRRDYAYAHNQYGLNAQEFEATYPVPASNNRDLIERLLQAKSIRKDSPITIQIGNSATATNQHFEALDAIAQYKDENIRLFIPLNYGANDYEGYADAVIARANSLFGSDRVNALTERVDGISYLKLLSDVDIGIFDNNRQQAMGNISQLILLGAKVFIRQDVSMWQHFESLGCRLAPFESIAGLPFDDFINYDSDTKRNNIAVIEHRHSIEEKVTEWGHIFTEMKNQS